MLYVPSGWFSLDKTIARRINGIIYARFSIHRWVIQFDCMDGQTQTHKGYGRKSREYPQLVPKPGGILYGRSAGLGLQPIHSGFAVKVVPIRYVTGISG